MQVFFGNNDNQTLGTSFLRKVGKVTKKAVTAPAKVAAKTVKVVAKPVIGKKASNYLAKGVNLSVNPYDQASLAKTGTKKVIGKAAYSAVTKSKLNPLNNKTLLVSTASNILLPGSGIAVASGLKAASSLRSSVNKAKAGVRNVKSFVRPLAKAGSSFLPDRTARQNIQDIVQKNIPQIPIPEEKAQEIEATDQKVKNNFPLIIGGIAVAGFLISRKR